MRKLAIQCDCGQRLQAPRVALGKVGRCPACAREFIIDSNTATNLPWSLRGKLRAAQPVEGAPRRLPNGRDAKERFGRAVDLYSLGRYAEALALLEELIREFPASNEIRLARDQCAKALGCDCPAPASESTPGDVAHIDLAEIRQVARDLLRADSPPESRLRAAELALRILEFENRKNGARGSTGD